MKLVSSWLLAALVMTGSREAKAEPPPIVHVFVAGSPEAVSGTRDALQDQCAHPNLVVMVQDAASADAELLDTARSAGLADAYVDLRPDNETRVVVVDGQTHAQLEGRTLGQTSSLEMSIEMVAQVVCAAIDSTLSARAAAAVAPAVPPPPAPLPPSAPLPAPLPPPSPVFVEPTTRVHDRTTSAWAGIFGVGANYGAGVHGGGGAMVGAGMGGAELRLGGALLVDGFPAKDLAKQQAQASLDLYGARLLATLEWTANSRLALFAGLGGGLDWLRVSAGSPPPGGVAQNQTSGVDPMLASLLGAKLALGLHVSACFALGADLDLAPHRYINDATGTPSSFFEPPRIRAVGLAGLAVTFDHEVAGAGPGTTNTTVGLR